MKASTRQVDGVTIVDLSGRITLGEGSVVLRDTIKDLLGKGVSAFTSVRNQGGELKLLHLTKKVHDLLQITKLYTVFDVKDDEAGAIAAFTK
jgi:anti-sigma B factor antagonist